MRVFQERLPNRRITCFKELRERLRGKGCSEGDKKLSRRVQTAEMEKHIIHMAENDPNTSSRLISTQEELSKNNYFIRITFNLFKIFYLQIM
ncbi:hypothetical protein BDFB_013268, partial [Asbolus verrucosus]